MQKLEREFETELGLSEYEKKTTTGIKNHQQEKNMQKHNYIENTEKERPEDQQERAWLRD